MREGESGGLEQIKLMTNVFWDKPLYYTFHPLGAKKYFDRLHDEEEKAGLPVSHDWPFSLPVDITRCVIYFGVPAWIAYEIWKNFS